MHRLLLALTALAMSGCATDTSVYGPFYIGQERTLENAMANRATGPVPTATPVEAPVLVAPSRARVDGPRRLETGSRSAW